MNLSSWLPGSLGLRGLKLFDEFESAKAKSRRTSGEAARRLGEKYIAFKYCFSRQAQATQAKDEVCRDYFPDPLVEVHCFRLNFHTSKLGN